MSGRALHSGRHDMLVKQVVDAVRAQLGATGIGEQRLILGQRRFSHPGGEYDVCIFA